MAKGKHGKKTSLKATLSSQQARLKKKQEARQAAHQAEKAQTTASKGKGKVTVVPQRPTIPFSATDHILLVGEGNFSFTRALVLHPPTSLEFLPPQNVTSTAYDSEDECYAKYPDAAEIVQSLREKGVEVIFGVDATKLEKLAALKDRKWDKIVWNFPHAGKGITDQDRNILSNQLLLLDFLRSAASSLATGPIPSVHISRKRKRDPDDDQDDKEGASDDDTPPASIPKTRGTVLITLRNVPPYTLWYVAQIIIFYVLSVDYPSRDLPMLAKNPPPPTSTSGKPNPRYLQMRSFVFHKQLWQGYEHRMTKGERAHGQGRTGEGGEDRTWEFCLKD
ncbi:hypothetical protein CERSUDRAFT_41630 [Gelatoporia subvermispora B]|uniref:25S rRNA (uridine-N(3))-methyltransferase BMT5-like domain-containing protein n=1 Tax=Ceriporiopsis subvermispora (strain B) TaxID=914234 RepID=M2RV12_CERS8|nr:hypothetical protein CERSUDRAFT_41630 [Gelatoporia subvermispora B]